MKKIKKILRINHAGEYGAINIYSSQIFVSGIFYRDIVPKLEEKLRHEKAHFKHFNNLIIQRNIRHCYALSIWGSCGFLLGFITALMGRNAIWTCTDAIESTVLKHLERQLEFLSQYDQEAYDTVLSIKADEESHRVFGQSNSTNTVLNKMLFNTVKLCTELAIWLGSRL